MIWARGLRFNEHRSPDGANLVVADKSFALNASGNYIHAPGKFVAAVG